MRNPVSDSPSPIPMTIKADPVGDMQKEAAWKAIITGLASSGQLDPEMLAKHPAGGPERVKMLAVHAKGLAIAFHKEFVKANG